MKDVAREAGVALGTVSKVVNGIPVGDSYRIRVENAINKLGYQVNSYAQGLRADKTHTVVFLIPNTTEPFYASLTYHVNLVLLRQGDTGCCSAAPTMIQIWNRNISRWHSRTRLTASSG